MTAGPAGGSGANTPYPNAAASTRLPTTTVPLASSGRAARAASDGKAAISCHGITDAADQAVSASEPAGDEAR